MAKLTLFLLSFFILSLTAQEIELTHKGPQPPFKSAPAFKDHDITVFATSPQVNSPVAVIAEPDGAVLALCDGNAGLGLAKNQGSILRLVDKDGDGKADVMTKFVENIDTPRGGHFLNGTLYLMHPPYISSFRDTDSDGKADEHKVLAKGFGHDLSWRRGGDHTANDLRVGIDGWIYTAIGDFGARATGSDGSKVQLYGGGVIRMRLDGSDLQIYSNGTRNTYDLAISHKLDLLALDNTNDGDGWNMRLHHLTPMSHMGYPHLYKFFSEDTMPPLYDHGGGSGVGAIYLQEPGFPEWFNDRFHTMSWGRMYTHSLKAHEATFINEDFISLQFSKLLEVDVDGSSRLYLSTFENGGARTKPGTTVGRIFQAKPKGWKYRKFPAVEKLTVDELISSLDKRSNVLRHNAQIELIRRKDKEINSKLKSKVEETTTSIEARIAALYAINLRNNKNAVTIIKSFLKDDSIKEYALRALVDRRDNKSISLNDIIAQGISDKSPRVQMFSIFGARILGLNELTHEILKISDDSEERTPLVRGKAHVHRAVPHTARRALVEMMPISELISALKKAELKKATLAVIRQIHDKKATQVIMDEMQTAKSFQEKLPFIKVLLRIYNTEEKWDGNSWWGTKPNSAGPYYKSVNWEMSKPIANALRDEVKGMSKDEQNQLLFLIRLHNINLDELNLDIQIDPIEQLVNQSTHGFSQLSGLLSAVNDTNRSDEFRLKAFRAALNVTGFAYQNWCIPILQSLSKIPADSELFKTMSQDFVTSSSHRITFMQRIPKTYNAATKMKSHIHRLYCDMAIGLILSPLTSDDDRSKLISGMQKVPTVELIESIAANRAKVLEGFIKKNLKNKNSKISSAAKKALASFSSTSSAMKGKKVQDLDYEVMKKAILNMEGDKELGKKLFTRQSCIACHSVLPSEPQKGPYLGTVGNLFDREQLITHIVKPGAEVAQGFQSYSFTMKDGSLINGFVTARDDKMITVRSMIGTSQTIKVKDLAKETVSKNSMMPPGLVNTLTLEEFASLIDYLQSLH